MGDPRRRRSGYRLVTVGLLSIASCCTSLTNPPKTHTGFQEAWRWVTFNPDMGVPTGQILNLYDLPNGDVWVHTTGGLAWYDGFRWHPARIDSFLRANISSGSMSADTDGVMIVAGGVLYAVDRTTSHRLPVRYRGSPVTVLRAARLASGEIILQSDHSLYSTRDSLAQVFPSPYESPSSHPIPEYLYGLMSKPTGEIWLNASGGIYRWRGERWKRVVVQDRSPGAVSALAVNESGDGVAVVESGGAKRLLEWWGDSAATPVAAESGQGVVSIDISRDGSVLALFASGEIRMRQRGEWRTLEPFPSHINIPVFLRFRPNGDLWVGTDGGLHLCRSTDSLWSLITNVLPDANYTVNDILQARDGSLWWATSWGVSVLTPGGSYRRITEIDGHPILVVTGVNEDVDGNIWICSGPSFAGAYRWDGRKWKHFGEAEGLRARNIHRIMKDRQGRLWFLTISPSPLKDEEGAFVLDRGGFTNLGVRDGLPDGRVYTMAEDSTGSLWFGTLTGLSRLRDGKWTYWSKGNGLRSEKIFVLLIDRYNHVWFGHQKHGLGYIDAMDHPCYVGAEEGLQNQDVWSLAMDEEGRLWVASRGGISVQVNGVWSTITTHHGLPNSFLWPLLSLKNTLLIGTQGSGIVAFRYGTIPRIPPVVQFNEPMIRRDETMIGWNCYAYWGSVSSDRVESRYRIDGGPWSTWRVQDDLILHNASWGKHTIEVEGKGLMADVTVPPALLVVEIPPPLFLRPYVLIPFLSLVVLLAGTAGIFYIRKREYDRELRRQDARYRAVVEHQSELIARVSAEGAVTFVNDAFLRFFNRKRLQVIGRRLDALLPPDEYASFREVVERTGDILSGAIEVTLSRADGERRWVRWSGAHIVDIDGTTRELQLVGSDVTQQRHARDEVEENERRYRIIAEQTGQLVYDYEIATGRIRWSGAVQEVTGFSPEEFRHVTADKREELIHPDDRSNALNALKTSIATGERYQVEYRLRRRDSTYITVFDNGILVDDGQGAPLRVLGTINNITSRKLAEEQIAESLKEKEVLVKEVHHRVKNNLQIISSLLNFQALSLADPKALEQLHESQDRIRSMALVHERLYQSGNLADISYGDYIRDLANSLFRSYNVNNVRLSLAVQDVRLGVNTAIPCGLILNELISNALRHAFPGGKEGEVDVAFGLNGDHQCVLTVMDTGVGFPMDVDFRNSPGLGLQLVHTLTAQIDGSIEMRREGGTVFTLVFPFES